MAFRLGMRRFGVFRIPLRLGPRTRRVKCREVARSSVRLALGARDRNVRESVDPLRTLEDRMELPSCDLSD
jgi:hypothetical protein